MYSSVGGRPSSAVSRSMGPGGDASKGRATKRPQSATTKPRYILIYLKDIKKVISAVLKTFQGGSPHVRVTSPPCDGFLRFTSWWPAFLPSPFGHLEDAIYL